MSVKERREWLSNKLNKNVEQLLKNGGLTDQKADLMIENCIGVLKLPLGLGLNFVINGEKKMIPMVTEEPSVIAAACYGAKIIGNNSFGFRAMSIKNIMRGQIFIKDVKEINPHQKLNALKGELMKYANTQLCKSLVKRGGGVSDILMKKARDNETYLLYILVNVQDCMGSNIINTILEGLSPRIVKLLNAKLILSIVSNLAPERITKASFEIPVESLSGIGYRGLEVARKIVEANEIAKNDIFRACTHNKGIMNGIEAACLAVGQDIRAIEASCHVYSIYKYGKYRALTNYQLINNDKTLRGEIEVPFVMAIKGGVTNSNKLYQLNLEIMGNPSARQLGEIIVSLGLAQNFAALKALVTVGVQQGHMKLHARNVAINAGVPLDYVNKAVQYMVKKKCINLKTAKEYLSNYKTSLQPSDIKL